MLDHIGTALQTRWTASYKHFDTHPYDEVERMGEVLFREPDGIPRKVALHELLPGTPRQEEEVRIATRRDLVAALLYQVEATDPTRHRMLSNLSVSVDDENKMMIFDFEQKVADERDVLQSNHISGAAADAMNKAFLPGLTPTLEKEDVNKPTL